MFGVFRLLDSVPILQSVEVYMKLSMIHRGNDIQFPKIVFDPVNLACKQPLPGSFEAARRPCTLSFKSGSGGARERMGEVISSTS